MNNNRFKSFNRDELFLLNQSITSKLSTYEERLDEGYSLSGMSLHDYQCLLELKRELMEIVEFNKKGRCLNE